jgi:hypothetical protein
MLQPEEHQLLAMTGPLPLRLSPLHPAASSHDEPVLVPLFFLVLQACLHSSADKQMILYWLFQSQFLYVP